jgi:hypothetical protein
MWEEGMVEEYPDWAEIVGDIHKVLDGGVEPLTKLGPVVINAATNSDELKSYLKQLQDSCTGYALSRKLP